MLVSIGKGRGSDGDLVDLLLECHGRIRSFSVMARAAAERTDLPAGERADACARVERYFTEALPLHVADEEDSVLPRLRGLDGEVDRALQAMHDQHAEHEAALRALLAAAAVVRSRPDDPGPRTALAAAAAAIERAFAEHLRLEEEIIFPAMRRLLPAADLENMVAELRQRRERR